MGNVLERSGPLADQLFVTYGMKESGGYTAERWRVYVQEAHANNYRIKLAEMGFKTKKITFRAEEEE